jgi:outer membrane protein assembly factor BamA
MLKKLLTQKNITRNLIFIFIFTIVNTSPAVSFELEDISFDVERRKPQFENEYSHGIIPVPYRIPGIGEGLGFGMVLSNIKGSYIDLYGLAIQGDVEGYAIAVNDFHIVPERLIFDFGYSKINKASFPINYSRGMEGDENPDDFNQAEISNSTNYGGQLYLTFDERKYELNLYRYRHISQVDRIRDPDGDILFEIDDPEGSVGTTTGLSVTVDLTDDRHDPRKGFRINILSDLPGDSDEDEINYYTIDVNTTAYFPVLSYSTLVFNFFKSDTHVLEKGETDRNKIAEKYSISPCLPGDTECEEARDFYIDKIYAQNSYGSASSLGGLSRLRSFSTMRYRGAHTRFFGTEFRWNLTDEKTPFNLWFLKDIRTSFQIAFFYEIGSIADHEEDLFEETRHSTGVGLRAVMASGIVFRIDVATGEEGSEFVIFFDYPWTFL